MSRAVLLRRGLTAAAALALAVPLAAASPAQAAPAATAATAAAPAVAWAPCAGFAGFDCATYDVPLDYDQPGLGTVRLALNRRPADDQANKIGSLFLNPGGPGGAGLGFARAASQVLFNDEIRAKFDIVGFDPRGVGQSTPVQCFATDEEFLAVLGPVPSVPLGAAEVSATLRAYKTYTTACGANGGPLLAHMSTLNVVKDLDRLRQAVGDSKLTYAGYSYGTLIGATYANLFPGKVRALLLDGMVDPAERTQRSLLNELNRAGGFETALRGFLELCAASGPDCAFSEGDEKAKFAALRERLRRGPLTLSDGSTVTISALTDYVGGQLYDPGAFPETAETLQALYDEAFPATTASKTSATARRVGVRGAGRPRRLPAARRGLLVQRHGHPLRGELPGQEAAARAGGVAGDRGRLRGGAPHLRPQPGLHGGGLRHLAGGDQRALRRAVGPVDVQHGADRRHQVRPGHALPVRPAGDAAAGPGPAAHPRRVRPHVDPQQHLHRREDQQLHPDRRGAGGRNGLPAGLAAVRHGRRDHGGGAGAAGGGADGLTTARLR